MKYSYLLNRKQVGNSESACRLFTQYFQKVCVKILRIQNCVTKGKELMHLLKANTISLLQKKNCLNSVSLFLRIGILLSVLGKFSPAIPLFTSLVIY